MSNININLKNKLKIILSNEFRSDIENCKDLRLITAAFKRIWDKNGNFIQDSKDHFYKGIDKLWIRRLTEKPTSYRAYYYKLGSTILLYRLGNKNTQKNIAPIKYYNNEVETSIMEATLNNTNEISSKDKKFNISYDGKLLFSKKERSFSTQFSILFHEIHKKICLVSPYPSFDIFNLNHMFGRFICNQIEENAIIQLITLPPTSEKTLVEFEKIHLRSCVECFFVPSLHSKLYYFEIDKNNSSSYLDNDDPISIVGSANLSKSALNFEKSDSIKINEEIGYKLPNQENQNISNYIQSLIAKSIDLVYVRSNKKKYIKDN